MIQPEKPCVILLLDDDEDDYVLVKAMLNGAFGEGVKLEWFQRDHFSTMMICSGIYQVTLVDYRLGNEDGLEVIRKAKEVCELQNIILLSGWTDPSIRDKAEQAGADGYLSKSDLSEQSIKEVLAPMLNLNQVGGKRSADHSMDG
jgi:CheY-like chemotaxis protein